MKKNILLVDDSALMRRVISDIINSDARFHVSEVAVNGLEALDKVIKNYKQIDAIILDITMPKMNGLEFLEQLEKNRIKAVVIVVSTLAKAGAEETIRALELGAFDFVTKPENFLDTKSEAFKQKILKTLMIATKVDNESRTVAEIISNMPKLKVSSYNEKRAANSDKSQIVNTNKKNILVALACSTGGPKALQSVIPLLPTNLNAPVVIVQHMPEGFTKSLAERLDDMSQIKVKEAEDGECIKKGVVYIARGGSQLKLKKCGSDIEKIQLTKDPPIGGLRPCADIMYNSLTDSPYDEIVCVVLTGMGGDGTKGILTLKQTKNICVIAQDAATCTVYGMPKVIIETGIVNEVLPLDKIADAIVKNVGVQ